MGIETSAVDEKRCSAGVGGNYFVAPKWGCRPVTARWRGAERKCSSIRMVGASLIVGAAIASSPVQAGSFSFEAFDQGWYKNDGSHTTSNTNYLVQSSSFSSSYRNFFAFDLSNSTLDGRYVNAAQLRLNTYDINGSSTYLSYDVNTSRSALLAGAGGTTAYNDLGTGNIFGGTSITASNIDVTTNLNSAALNSSQGINAAINGSDSRFLIGGRVTTSGRWAFSNSGSARTQGLTIQTLDPVLAGTSSVSFGNVLVGSGRNASVVVANNGDSRTTLTGQFNGASGSEFTPNGSQGFNVSGGSSTSRTYAYAPTARGVDSATTSVTTQISGSRSVGLSGRGVAALGSATGVSTGNTRIGTTGSAGVQVNNSGDGNLSGLGSVSNLRGTAQGAAGGSPFSGGPTGFSIGDGGQQVVSYGFTPTGHGAANSSVVVNYVNGATDGTNQGFSQTVTLSGTGVGPELGANYASGDTVDFGEIGVNQSKTLLLDLGNITTDPELGNLTALSLLGYTITGPDASAFAFGLGAPIILLKGDTVSLAMAFDPTQVGSYIASLTLSTDINSAFGQAGDIFTLNLVAEAVPTPASIALFGIGLLGLMRLARRRNEDGNDATLSV